MPCLLKFAWLSATLFGSDPLPAARQLVVRSRVLHSGTGSEATAAPFVKTVRQDEGRTANFEEPW